MMFEMAWRMSKDSLDMAWWAIIGATERAILNKVESRTSVLEAGSLQGHVSRLNHRQGVNMENQQHSAVKITYDREYVSSNCSIIPRFLIFFVTITLAQSTVGTLSSLDSRSESQAFDGDRGFAAFVVATRRVASQCAPSRNGLAPGPIEATIFHYGSKSATRISPDGGKARYEI